MGDKIDQVADIIKDAMNEFLDAFRDFKHPNGIPEKYAKLINELYEGK